MVQELNDEVYLVIADETEEFQLALRYVALLAKDNGAHMAILYIMDKQDFQHWGDIQKRMQWEQRLEGEKLIWAAAARAYEISGLIPSLYLEEGGRLQVIIDVINRDRNLKKLILGGATHGSNPGPLTTYFTGKGLAQLRVPLTIVPGNLTLEDIDQLL